MSIEATAGSFDEVAYLAGNPDVREAVERGNFTSGRQHFDAFGIHEHRLMRMPVTQPRAEKLDRIKSILRPDMKMILRNGKPDFLTQELRDETKIVDTTNVSGHGYDSAITDALQVYDGELALDCGAGRRGLYYHDVVNYEIVDYDSTDVIGVGEELPFVDGAFSVVISIAVLEHVRDPFRCAAELVRVLRPGGRLICAMPFLQPVHGYPHHYFNATPQGLRRLFEDSLVIEDQTVPDSLHPIWALRWIVESWSNGLRDGAKSSFLNQPVRDLLRSPDELMRQAFCQDLPVEKKSELACGSLLIATK